MDLWKYGAIAIAVIAVLGGAYMKGSASCVKEDAKADVKEVKTVATAVITKAAENNKSSSDIHQQTVTEVATTKEKIHVQAKADRSAVVAAGISDDGLRNGAAIVAASVHRANGEL